MVNAPLNMFTAMRNPPAERAPEAVREDVRNGYVSPQAAADVYRQPQEEQ